jgi:hypothetical protein
MYLTFIVILTIHPFFQLKFFMHFLFLSRVLYVQVVTYFIFVLAFIIFWNTLPYKILYRAIILPLDVSVSWTDILFNKFPSDILSLHSSYSAKGQVSNPGDTTC